MELSRCANCGRTLPDSGNCDHCKKSILFLIFRRELVLLIVLGSLTIPLFLFTRSMAARNRAVNIQAGAAWYKKGQEQLRDQNIPAAISSFRKATTSDHDNPQYMLAMAVSLAATNHVEEARQALVQLRASAPESGEVNLQLARLAARDESVAEAVRYYHNALYGVWPAHEMTLQRRTIRTELIHFLLKSGDKGQALSELLILGSDIPDTEEAHNDVGRLFLSAGDSKRALEHFQKTLRFDRKNVDAMDGAGRAAFNTGDYKKAHEYLDAAIASGRADSATADLLEIATLVLSHDPLLPALRSDERVKRLLLDLGAASENLQFCIAKAQPDSDIQTLTNLSAELAQDLKVRYRPADLKRDADGFRLGLSLIYRIETAAERICHETSPVHKALLLIAEKYGATGQ